MCGFGGEVRFDGALADLRAVERMSEPLRARGPDGCGFWSSGSAALVHRRLRIIDLSEAGAQPMVDSELGLTLAFNGCIYNYRELREQLSQANYRFFSKSDSEVILKAYHHWGERCVEHFHGMFAFVIIERGTGRVMMARDRLGIKPLYVATTPARVRFASTLPALVAAGDLDTSIDPIALHHYMTFHSVVPAPRTILAGIAKLPPATVRVIERDGTARDTCYWRPEFSRPTPLPSAQEWQHEVLTRLRTAVKRRMVADVPVGVLLSGGLDSSLIVALLAESGQRRLNTFSIGFEDAGGESGNEFVYSDLVAARFETDHHQIRIDTQRLLPAIDGAIHAMSEPMVSHDAVAFYLLSQEVAKHVRVVQSGQGADEVFAGYDWYPPLAGVPRDDAASAYESVFFDRSHDQLRSILAPQWMLDRSPSSEFLEQHFAAPGADTTVDAALRVDSQIMLVDDPVKRVDNMTMAFGLEGRVPFLDHELVELAARCPAELKLADGGKGVLKAASRGVVPDAVIDRTKGYFPVPAIRHLEGPLLERVRDALHTQAARDRHLFRADYVSMLFERPNEVRTTLGSNVLWQLGLLELWLQSAGVG
jgi:asparagine synthase (glutamine-hydrolysing)